MSTSKKPSTIESFFYELVPIIKNEAHSDEFFAASFAGEDSDFCRFNKGLARQAGSVSQKTLELKLVKNRRQVRSNINLTGIILEDRAKIRSAFERARALIPILPEDPHVMFSESVNSTNHTETNLLPPYDEVMSDVLRDITGKDFVGIYAGGGIYRGFTNSLGQTNWFESYNFNLDWSIFLRENKAVKSGISGKNWNPNVFKLKMAGLSEQLSALARTNKALNPGNYRVYFTPTAMSEIFGLLSWGGFGLRSQKIKASPLLKLVDSQVSLSNLVSVSENTRDGACPNFDSFGFTRPDEVALITAGKHSGSLISASSGKEFGLTPNGASEGESPNSIDMAAGLLPTADALKTLDTGLHINNLWYLNYSDRSSCRITGMTRFATFWVENGRIVAPVGVMRFDDSIYRMLGSNLIGLTKEREFLLDPATYDARSTGSFHLPGALISDLALTL